MPYYISENHPDCSNWAVVKTDYELVACHDTKESAISQMVALSQEEDLEPGGTHPRDERSSEANKPKRKFKVSEKTKIALESKVKEHNEKMQKAGKPEHTLVSYKQLDRVYRRGAEAYAVSHRPGVSRAAWAMARVNSHLYLLRNEKPKDPKYTADNDLLAESHPMSNKSSKLKEVMDRDLYSQLQGDEKALVDAMYGIVQEYGRFGDEDSTVYIEYQPPAQNDNKDNGIKCGNCVFHYEAEDGLACSAINAEIQDGGLCRLAMIPPGYFQETIKVREAEKMYKVPEGVQNAAKRAQKWISDGKAGDGFTDTGRRRASQLASGGSVSLDTVKRMKSYFARHEVDRKATGFNSGEEGYPSAGRVAWDAWGGDAGRTWVNRLNLEDD